MSKALEDKLHEADHRCGRRLTAYTKAKGAREDAFTIERLFQEYADACREYQKLKAKLKRAS